VLQKGAQECWPWIGRSAEGYGRFRFDGRDRSAHRISWELHNGRRPTAQEVVRHLCNHSWCVNPRHLRLGVSGRTVMQ
jgi:hypothetical protein